MANDPKPFAALDRPRPLHDIVRTLADAVDHLLADHACAAHGYESVAAARDAARSWLIDFDECTTTERLSAIEAFEKIAALVEHDSPVYLVAVEEWASLAHEHRSKAPK